jgi:hypothetical protein
MSPLRQLVWNRANGRCEYCQIAQTRSVLPHALDHIVARMHGGGTVESNLCLACAQCNGRKGTNLTGIDPETGQISRLFHPRTDQWSAHFRWRGSVLEGLTEVGRTTIAVLDLNSAERLAIRLALIESSTQGDDPFSG